MLNLIYSGDFTQKTSQVRNQMVLKIFNYKNSIKKRKNYKKIKNPILIIAGKNDELVPKMSPTNYTKDSSEDFYQKILKLNRNTKLIMLENCGHMIPIEQPVKVNKLIKNFIDS